MYHLASSTMHSKFVTHITTFTILFFVFYFCQVKVFAPTYVDTAISVNYCFKVWPAFFSLKVSFKFFSDDLFCSVFEKMSANAQCGEFSKIMYAKIREFGATGGGMHCPGLPMRGWQLFPSGRHLLLN